MVSYLLRADLLERVTHYEVQLCLRDDIPRLLLFVNYKLDLPVFCFANVAT